LNKKNWIIATLEEITEVNPTLDKTLFPDDLMVSFVPMPAVEAGTGKIDVNNTRRFSDVKKGYTPFQKDDVLFAKITPCMENGKMAVVPVVANQIGFGSTEFHVLRPRAGIDPSFVYYFISSQKFRYDAEHNMTGAVGQRRVPAQYLKTHPIPVPPFKEQKRIVAKIEELFSEIDKGVENLQKVQELLKAYRQSLLQNALEGKITENWRRKKANFAKESKQKISEDEQNHFLPELWIKSRLGDLVSQVSKKKMPHEHPEHPFLGMDCLEKNALKPHFTYRFKELKSAGNWFNKNHILYGRLRPYLNKVYRAEYEGIASGEFIVLQAISTINPDWLKYVLHAQSFVNWSNKQTTGDKPRVRYDQIALYSINVPPREEQDKIVQELELHLSICDKLEYDIFNKITEKSFALRQCILKKAFSGELVHQDENDGPVNVLLERIKTEKEPKKTPKKNSKQLQKVVI
jgi:type I restriction enzyme S subunit